MKIAYQQLASLLWEGMFHPGCHPLFSIRRGSLAPYQQEGPRNNGRECRAEKQVPTLGNLGWTQILPIYPHIVVWTSYLTLFPQVQQGEDPSPARTIGNWPFLPIPEKHRANVF